MVLNDPCQNPTGYTMTDLEWVKLVDLINEVSKDGTPFVLLHDMAYIDYDYRNVNDYLSVSTYYQDGKPINDKDIITKGTLRTVYVTIAYDKNVSDIQSFILNFDMMFNIH